MWHHPQNKDFEDYWESKNVYAFTEKEDQKRH